MAPGLAPAAASLGSQLGSAWEPPSPAQVAAISDCFIARAGSPPAEHRWGTNLGLHNPEKPQGQYTQWTATNHMRVPPPCSYTADPPRKAEAGGQRSQPILAADWPG